ncbi:uncharacterized protein TNCV_3018861 [Trichonephila clavipes]|nr:uncharacterized protein TNCV_3018861 [Trichonephila clavipes]
MLRTLIVLVSALGILLEVVKAETYCEQHRNREKNSHGLVKMVPNCDANGDYMPMQCFQGSKFCSCYDKSGNPITQPSTKLKSCKCLRRRKRSKIITLNEHSSITEKEAAVAEWYRHRIVAGYVTSSSPVPLKTRRVGQRCTLNLSRAETSSRWCGVVVRRGGASSGVVHVT